MMHSNLSEIITLKSTNVPVTFETGSSSYAYTDIFNSCGYKNGDFFVSYLSGDFTTVTGATANFVLQRSCNRLHWTTVLSTTLAITESTARMKFYNACGSFGPSVRLKYRVFRNTAGNGSIQFNIGILGYFS